MSPARPLSAAAGGSNPVSPAKPDTKGGMDSETYTLFFEQLKRYVTDRLVPAEEEVIQNNAIPDAILREMKELGLFGLAVPEEYGGAGMNTMQYIQVMAELSWAAPAYRTIISIGNGIVTSAIANNGTEAQKQEWLPKIASGAVASFAITEPDSGSDSAALRTKAERKGNGYVLNGSKRYITNAPFADVVLVMARTNAENLPKNGHISAFLVATDTKGVTIGSPDKKMGQEGGQIADVYLENVEVPGSALLGEVEGQGFLAAMQSLNGGRLSVASAALGMARRALDSGIRYALDRKAFGQPIANFQLMQAKFADSQADIYAAECMLKDACERLDRGEDVRLKAACVKLFISEMCGRVVDRVVQIYGGAGYLREYEAERFFRDSRIFRIYEGTSEIMQLVIAQQLLREYGHNVPRS